MNFSEEKMKKNSIAWFVVECTKPVRIELEYLESYLIFSNLPKQLVRNFQFTTKSPFCFVFSLVDSDYEREYFYSRIMDVKKEWETVGKFILYVKISMPIYDEFKNFSKLVNDWRDRKLDSFSSFLGIAMYETFPDWKKMKKLGVDYLKLWQEGFSEIGSRQIDREDYFNRMVRIEL